MSFFIIQTHIQIKIWCLDFPILLNHTYKFCMHNKMISEYFLSKIFTFRAKYPHSILHIREPAVDTKDFGCGHVFREW